MAAPILYKCKSATFKATSIVHANSVQLSRQGSSQMARGDGAIAMQIAWTEGVHDRITVNALEGDSAAEGNLTDMGNGALVCTLFKQADGSGAVAASDKIFTWANASLESITRGAPLDGVPTLNYNFIAVAADGLVASLLAIT